MSPLDTEAWRRTDGVRTPRQRRSEGTLVRVLDAAEELFTRHGVDGTSMAAVATAARSSVGALYGRFPDKAALVRAVQLRLIERQFGALATALAPAEATSAEPAEVALRRFIATLVRGMTAQAGLLRAVIAHAVRDDVMRQRISLALDETTAALAAVLRSEGKAFAHPDPALAADVIVRMVSGTLQQLVILERHIDVDDLTAELTRAATAYLGTRRRASKVNRADTGHRRG